jgi:hypothetical protein
MIVLREKTSIEMVLNLLKVQSTSLVKAVVDIEKEIIALGGDLHSDEEIMLIEKGSRQQDLWGINIYPDKPKESWIEFDSMVNIRPRQNNYSRDVEDTEKKKKIIEIVNKLIQ